VSSRSERDAAYFTLLRAREELDHLRRYQQWLDEELDRLEDVRRAVEAAGGVPRRFRRLVESTDKPLLEALGRRRAIVRSERDRAPERVAAQEAFVQECEADLAALG
jgi:hypothetical protein